MAFADIRHLCPSACVSRGGDQAPLREVGAAESGITWTHQNGRSEHRYLPETTGAGVAIFDYNNDGWMDIFLAESGTRPFDSPATPLRSALYRNNHDGTFTDVAKEAGITTDIYGMGVAIGDYDGDGHRGHFYFRDEQVRSLSQQRQWNIYRRHRDEWNPSIAVGDERGVAGL